MRSAEQWGTEKSLALTRTRAQTFTAAFRLTEWYILDTQTHIPNCWCTGPMIVEPAAEWLGENRVWAKELVTLLSSGVALQPLRPMFSTRSCLISYPVKGPFCGSDNPNSHRDLPLRFLLRIGKSWLYYVILVMLSTGLHWLSAITLMCIWALLLTPIVLLFLCFIRVWDFHVSVIRLEVLTTEINGRHTNVCCFFMRTQVTAIFVS